MRVFQNFFALGELVRSNLFSLSKYKQNVLLLLSCYETFADVINFKIYLQLSSKIMVDREKRWEEGNT